jgi:hypothetical protein
LNEIVNGALPDSATYRELIDAVNDAKEKQEEATYRLSDAIHAEETAIKALATAYRELTTAADAAGKTVNIPTVPVLGATAASPNLGQFANTNKVQITVDSSIVNPLQVAQEIQDYLDILARSNGLYAV